MPPHTASASGSPDGEGGREGREDAAAAKGKVDHERRQAKEEARAAKLLAQREAELQKAIRESEALEAIDAEALRQPCDLCSLLVRESRLEEHMGRLCRVAWGDLPLSPAERAEFLEDEAATAAAAAGTDRGAATEGAGSERAAGNGGGGGGGGQQQPPQQSELRRQMTGLSTRAKLRLGSNPSDEAIEAEIRKRDAQIAARLTDSKAQRPAPPSLAHSAPGGPRALEPTQAEALRPLGLQCAHEPRQPCDLCSLLVRESRREVHMGRLCRVAWGDLPLSPAERAELQEDEAATAAAAAGTDRGAATEGAGSERAAGGGGGGGGQQQQPQLSELRQQMKGLSTRVKNRLGSNPSDRLIEAEIRKAQLQQLTERKALRPAQPSLAHSTPGGPRALETSSFPPPLTA